jgi:PAS domain S-box-containing protein
MPPLLAGAQVNQEKILILNSYHKGFIWTDNFVNGVESTLKPEVNNIDLSIEYMDTKNMGYGEDYKQKLYELYQFKYHDHEFDAIISSDDDAFNFLNEYHDNLFPGVPVVYGGVNNREAPNLTDPSLFTGVLESLATDQTIDLILQFHPQTRKIYLIIDTTPSGDYLWGVTLPSVNLYPEIEFIRITDQYSIGEIESLVSELGEDSAIIFYVLSRDKSGKYFSVKESATRIITASSRPVYTTHLLEFPYGVVGGKILQGYNHGEFVAKMAKRILNGKAVNTIPVVKKSPTQFVFNYDQLKKWDISLSALPADSVILNQPVSFYEQNKALALGVLVFIFTMTGIVIILQINILRRKKAENTLRESEEKFKALADTSPLAIYASSGMEQKAEYINPAFTKLLGYTLDEVPTIKDLWLLAYPEENYRTAIIDEWQNRVAHAIAAKTEIEPMELVVTCKDGSEKNISWGFSAGGKQNWALGLDLTKRRQAEAERQELEIQQRQKFKMEALGVMAGGMAHNFNNNLSIVLGNLELASLQKNLTLEMQDFLLNAKTGALRSRDQIKQMMIYSRSESQQEVPTQLGPVINETLKLLRSTIPSSIDLQYDATAESQEAMVLADATQIQEILLNLYNNAVHAMEETGQLTISWDRTTLQAKDIPVEYSKCLPGEFVRLSVKDTGCGMTTDMLEQIFIPFYTTKVVGEGTGMGLSTVQGMMIQLGGKIEVRSALGQGSTFKLYFPITGKRLTDTTAVKGSQLPQGTEHILLVDDDEMLVQLGDRMLSELGYQVTSMTSSTEALKLFAAKYDSFDLVISDQTMPDLLGSDLIAELFKIKPDLPSILCTGYSSKITSEQAIGLGIKGFLMKPYEHSVLAQLVREVLDKN